MDEKKRSKLTNEFYELTKKNAQLNANVQQNLQRLQQIHNELENAKSKQDNTKPK
jgi:vacuolar-type H+-ATPase subunit D/Vma8